MPGPKRCMRLVLKKSFWRCNEQKGFRCQTCTYTTSCEYFKDIHADEFLKKYYLEAEEEDGYIRDRCVFDERVDIYDHMSVNVSYDNDSLLTYSLVANSPYEGWRASINGSKGRMEIQNTFRNADMKQEDMSEVKIFYPDRELEKITIDTSAPGHGGGDERLRKVLFGEQIEDPLGQQADSYAGAKALLIGAMANESIKDGKMKEIPNL